MPYRPALIIIFGLAAPLRAAETAAPAPAVSTPPADLEGRPISSVTLKGNRTKRSALESRIALKEGAPFHEKDLEQTRRNLYAMRLFKRVEIEAVPNAQGGVDVAIDLADGWYVVPIPFFFGGGGGSGAALTLSERNYFGSAESVYASVNYNSAGEGGRIGGSLGPWSGSAGYSQASYTQYGYSNGSFSSQNFFENSKNLSNPSQYGTVVTSFNKTIQTGSAMGQYLLTPNWRAGLGFTESHVDYSQPTGPVPSDEGQQNWAEARLAWSAVVMGAHGFGPMGVPSPWSVSGGAMAEMIGSIFGLGLADVGERIRPLPEPRLRLGADAVADVGTPLLGSDFAFSRYTVQGTAQYEFVDRHTLSLRVTASQGYDLPFSRLIATNGALGLRGFYIREFFGDQGVGASLAGSYLLRQTKRGVWSVDAFVETAEVSGAGLGGGTLEGIGGGVHYTFWRFPLPLGLGYSYSLTDHNGQITFAAGGRFGG